MSINHENCVSFIYEEVKSNGVWLNPLVHLYIYCFYLLLTQILSYTFFLSLLCQDV